MAFNVDSALDRRRLKRRLTVWRIIGIIALMIAGLSVIDMFAPIDGMVGRSYVARLDVDGLITGDAERERALADLAEDPAVRALIVEIDSPGGTVVGGESLFVALRRVAAKKPVVAVMGEMATSGGYMTALGADYIFARQGTLTGSIGVILQTVDVTSMLDKLGIKPESVKSDPLKAQPSPLEPFTEDARRAIQETIADTYQMFLEMVIERRRLAPEQARVLADGRVYTGRQALQNGLIDGLGGEIEARAWLAATHGIDEDLPLREIRIARGDGFLRDFLQGTLGKTLFSERLRLDGLIALWHPDKW
jgi:protease-4